MKKRSLFAAVAMLIVSAMVLTSATYAWFNVGGAATVGTTYGTVMTAAPGVRVKTQKTGAQWTNSLTQADFLNWGSGVTNPNHFAHAGTYDPEANDGAGAWTSADGSYAPVSSANGVDFFMYSMSGSSAFINSENAANVTNYYDSYQFRVATVVEQADVTATFTFAGVSGKSAAAAARAMVFTSTNGTTWTPYQENGSTVIFTAGSETASTYAVGQAIYTGTNDNVISDDNSNFIMDSADTGYTANSSKFTEIPTSQMKSAASGYAITLEDVQTQATSTLYVRTVIWIEGQDLDCAPGQGVDGNMISSAWNFAVAE
jgi:hypothetical protein